MLKLVTDETNFTTPKDIHFVYGIYAPLSVRLAQQFVKPNGIRIINDAVNLLPGPLFDEPLNQTKTGYGEQRSEKYAETFLVRTQKQIVLKFCMF